MMHPVQHALRGWPSRAGPILLVAVCLCLIPPAASGETETQDFALTFSSTTTIDMPLDPITISVVTDLISPVFNLDLEIVPTKGTYRIWYDNNLHLEWESTDATYGHTVPVSIAWEFIDGATQFGVSKLRGAFYVTPRWEIDFDLLMDQWGMLVGSYPIQTGIRAGRLANDGVKRLRLDDPRDIHVTEVGNPVMLGGTAGYMPTGGNFVRADSLRLDLSHRPYPCLLLELVADVILRMDYKVENVEACLRYNPSPDDTLCWEQTDSFYCLVVYGTDEIYVPVGCRDVQDLVVPFCPATARGLLDLNLEVDVNVLSFKLSYECSDQSLTPIEVTAVGPVTESLFHEEVELERARDDAIFVIPVAHPQPDMPEPQPAVYDVGENVPIEWSALDDAILGCCSAADIEVDITFRPADEDTSLSCAGVIATGIAYTASGYGGWTPSSNPCVDGEREFVVILSFHCTTSTEYVLAHSISDEFILDATKVSPPRSRWR